MLNSTPFSSQNPPRGGIHVALWIPTDSAGDLRRDLLIRHLDWLKECQVHGILALGSTGEFARMNLFQREKVLAQVIELASPLPVMSNISSIRLDEVISLGKTAARLGSVGAFLMPPSFFPLAQDDILEFFLRAAEQVPLPFYLYNYPEVTSNRIGPDVIRQFAKNAPMIGIKQSGGELTYHQELIALGNELNFSVFTAADPRLEEFLRLGAKGCIGGVTNFFADAMVKVYKAVHENSGADITVESERLLQIGKSLGPVQLPFNIRCALVARGFDPGEYKSPISAKTLSLCDEVTEEFKKLFHSWNLSPV